MNVPTTPILVYANGWKRCSWKALGLPHQAIGRIVRISQATLRQYLQMY